MDVFRLAERAMSMDDDAWMRHSNPLSVWTRFICLPLLVLAIWSRDWLGWWALIPIALAVVWIWLNPRVFPPPRSTDNWASKGVLGERVFLNRHSVPIPGRHRNWAMLLLSLSALGLTLLVWGLWHLDIATTILGLLLAELPKIWFVHRMAGLYEEMQDADPTYRSWFRS